LVRWNRVAKLVIELNKAYIQEYFVFKNIFRLNEQARVSWNSDVSYIYPIYDIQGTLGNWGQKPFLTFGVFWATLALYYMHYNIFIV
jgi:hypothetical protein